MRSTIAGAAELRPPLLRRVTERQIRWLDRAMALCFYVSTFPGVADYRRDHVIGIGGLFVLAAGASLPIAFRRRAPIPVFVITTVCLCILASVGASFAPEPILAIPTFQIASRFDRRTSLRWLAFALFGLLLAILLNTSNFTSSHVEVSLALFAIAAWFVGDSVRVRRAYTAGLTDQALQRSREEVERAHRSVAEERLRIARELHDVVAHTLSVVAVQSGMGRHVIDTQPGDAKRALAAIEETSRSALGELRRMLGMLRQDDSPANLAPTPGVDDLATLAAQIRDAGVPVDLTVVIPDGAALSPTLDLSVYRIVQEALTNVVKHAGRANASVRIAVDADSLVVTIVDNGAGAAAKTSEIAPGSRHGIVGMRERAAIFGGTVVAGPCAEGGFSVVARLPLAGASA